uniref:hypothetical protein n=1 Tax=uncultured Sphingomonas sp. TaxID=158754 RepID=UPI0035CB705A
MFVMDLLIVVALPRIQGDLVFSTAVLACVPKALGLAFLVVCFCWVGGSAT